LSKSCYKTPMKYPLLFIFCIFISISANAQLDSQQKSTAIPAEENKDAKSSSLDIKPSDIESLNTINEGKLNGISVPNSDNNIEIAKEEFSMFGDEEFANPAELYKKQLKKNLKIKNQAEIIQYGETTNQFLGDFKTGSKFVNIVYRDHEYFDGDRIRVYYNDDVIERNILLEGQYKGFKLTLKEGFNKIDFQALNQGTSGPNTAEFKVMDDNGVIISSNQWNLATGVKATIVFVKE